MDSSNSKTPKITIITVCFNSESTIEDTIKSVQLQNYKNIEYIIIDGDSSDTTNTILSNYKSDIDILVCETDKGIYDAMNKGIKIASGDIVGILNSDDFYPHENVLSNVMKEFELHPDVDMLLGNVDFVSPMNLIKPIRLYSAINFSPWKLRFGLMPAHPSAFIKKTAYEKVGTYKLNYKIGADFDMFVRMLLVKQLQYLKLDEVLVRMRTGGVSTSGMSSYITSTKEMLRSLKENQIYSNILMVLMRLPVKFFQVVLVKFYIK